MPRASHTRIDEGEQRVEHPLRATGGDDGLRIRVVGDAAQARDVAGRGRAQFVEAQEGAVTKEPGWSRGRPPAQDGGEVGVAVRVRASRTKAITSSTEEAVATVSGRSRARPRSPKRTRGRP